MTPAAVKSDTTLELRRTFNASKARVYAAWTNPEFVAKWFHPAEVMTTTVNTLNLQVGGQYQFTMHGDGDFVIGGTYQEIVPSEKLVFTWQWEGEEDTPPMLITLNFIEVDADNTEMILLHERFPKPEDRDNHEIGWEGTLVELERFLSS